MKNIYKAFINGVAIIIMLLLTLSAYEHFYY